MLQREPGTRALLKPRPCPSDDVSAGLLTVIPSGLKVHFRVGGAARPSSPPPRVWLSRSKARVASASSEYQALSGSLQTDLGFSPS